MWWNAPITKKEGTKKEKLKFSIIASELHMCILLNVVEIIFGWVKMCFSVQIHCYKIA